MRHPTRAEARALSRAQRKQQERADIQRHIDKLLASIMAIERVVVEAKVANQQRRLPRWLVVRHSALMTELVDYVNALDSTTWIVWSFFTKHETDEGTKALVAALIAPRLACMSTAHRRYKYARA